MLIEWKPLFIDIFHIQTKEETKQEHIEPKEEPETPQENLYQKLQSTAQLELGGIVQPEKRKRGRPRKIKMVQPMQQNDSNQNDSKGSF